MKAPTPPKELQEKTEQVLDEDNMEVEHTETVEVILFQYEDEEVSFDISFEFVYTFKQNIDAEVLLA